MSAHVTTRFSGPSVGRSFTFALALAAMCLTGCNLSPGWAEGVLDTETFHIQDTNPAYRVDRDSGEFHLAISEEDGVVLRVVTIRVPDLRALPLEVPVAVGPRDSGAPELTVSYGDLVVTDRGDGVRILSSENPRFGQIVDGNVTFTSTDLDEVTGYFHLDLVNDEYLDGSFATLPAKQ